MPLLTLGSSRQTDIFNLVDRINDANGEPYAVHFKVNDIYRIILPSAFGKRFRTNIPEYVGQIAFSDEYSREWSDDRKRPKISVITACPLEGNREWYIESGMNDYIAKPVQKES